MKLRLLLLSVLCVSCDCAPPPTGILVVVQASEGIQAEGVAMRIRTFGARAGETVLSPDAVTVQSDGPNIVPLEWPVRIAINPRAEDIERWALEVNVLDETGASMPVIQRRAQGAFVPGEIRQVVLYLFSECVGVPCEDLGETCIRSGVCEPVPDSPSEECAGARGCPDAGGFLDGSSDAGDTGADTGPRTCTDGCDDGDPCTDDSCDEASDTCISTARSNGSTCGDSRTCCSGDCVRFDNDGLHCGGCGLACSDTEACLDSECACREGFADCDGDPRNGCEAELDRDLDHCGECGEVCEGSTPACLSGSCGACGSASDCPAPLECQSGVACEEGACIYELSDDRCLIDSTCYAAGDPRPGVPCQACNPASNPDDWSANAGASCAVACMDSSLCDAGGDCGGGTMRDCNDGLSCTADSCDADRDACTQTLTSGCLIEGACVDAGADPGNICRACVPDESTSAYTHVVGECTAVGDRPGTCVSGMCMPTTESDCTIDGTDYSNGDPGPSPCLVCNRALSRTAWSARDNGSECMDGPSSGFCVSGVCQSSDCECFIAGACVAADTRDPSDDCQWCQPPPNRDYGDVTDGETCSGGRCLAGTCTTCDCFIDGACFASGAVNPANPCQRCAGPGEWIDEVEGSFCPGGHCIAGSCDLDCDCFVGLFCYEFGDENPANECEFCSIDSASSFSDKADGTPCGTGMCNSGACTIPPAGDCIIDMASYNNGDPNPANECEECNAALSASAWSPREVGYFCDGGTSFGCDGAGTCCTDSPEPPMCNIGGLLAACGERNTTNDCEVCDIASSSTMWTPAASGLPCRTPGGGGLVDGFCGGIGCVALEMGG